MLILTAGLTGTGLAQTALPDPGTMYEYRGNIGSSYTFLVTIPEWEPIWGTQYYTDDSNIGMAAGHWYGLISGQRYVVRVTMSAGLSSYNATTRYGITSLPWDSWPASFYFANYWTETMPGATIVTVQDVTTTTAITSFSNSGLGNGTSIEERGICYNTTGSPTIADLKLTSGSGTIASSDTLVNLSPYTTYYARAYATNNLGQTGYGTQVSFTTLVDEPALLDFTPKTASPGDTITITGSGFYGISAVSFGGTAAASFEVVSPATITAIVGAGSSGSVSVTNPGGTASLTGFTYVKRNQSITFAEPEAVTYGDEPFIVSALGGASGNPVVFTSSDPTVATCTGANGTTITIVKAGSCSLYANQAGNDSYNAAPQVAQTLTVNPAPLTLSGVVAADKVYDGNTDAELSGGTLSGTIGDDAVEVLAGTGNFEDKNAGVGKKVIATGYDLTGTDAGNYVLAAQPGGMTADITPADLLATAEDKTRAYGDPEPVFTIAYTGFAVGDDASDITEPATECEATDTSDVGTYAIVLSGGLSDNYEIALADGTLTVEKAVLTVTAEDKSRETGVENPELTLAYDGFKNGETTEVLDTLPVASCTADASSEPGDYDITVQGGKDNHYDFTYVTGTLTVVAVPTGMEDAPGHGYAVYPNPVTESLQIRYPPDESVRIQVFNAAGRLVINKKISDGTLDVRNLPVGLYTVKINGYSFKLVKK